MSFQNFDNEKFVNSNVLGVSFGLLFCLRGNFCGLTTVLYPDVTTTFTVSVFTVMPKTLTTGPKSRLYLSWHFQASKILYNSSMKAR